MVNERILHSLVTSIAVHAYVHTYNIAYVFMLLIGQSLK